MTSVLHLVYGSNFISTFLVMRFAMLANSASTLSNHPNYLWFLPIYSPFRCLEISIVITYQIRTTHENYSNFRMENGNKNAQNQMLRTEHKSSSNCTVLFMLQCNEPASHNIRMVFSLNEKKSNVRFLNSLPYTKKVKTKSKFLFRRLFGFDYKHFTKMNNYKAIN